MQECRMAKRFSMGRRLLLVMVMGFLAAELAAQESPVLQTNSVDQSSEAAAEPDAPPTMFPHLESDRFWRSGQANVITQWHPAFHSPYSGPNSLSPAAQDASSHVLT